MSDQAMLRLRQSQLLLTQCLKDGQLSVDQYLHAMDRLQSGENVISIPSPQRFGQVQSNRL